MAEKPVHQTRDWIEVGRALISRRDLVTTAALGWTASLGAAETWKPARPIQIIVPGTAGGVPDVIARKLATQLQADLGQPVVVDYKPGASGRIGEEYVQRSPHDGHTLLICYLGPSGLLPAFDGGTTERMGAEGFEAAGFIGEGGAVVVTSGSQPWSNLGELARDIRANPGFIPYFGSPGAGTILRLYSEMICAHMGRRGTHVAYKGVAPVLTDVIAGHLTFATVTLPPALPLIAAGRIRALATTSTAAVPELSAVKTLKAQGFDEADVSGWYAIWVGERTPQPAVQALNASINRFVSAPESQPIFGSMGMTPTDIRSPAEVRSRLAKDMLVWKKAIRTLGLKVDG